MDKVREYIDANKERFLEELFELLRIPSISAVTEYAEARQRCAEHLAAALVKAGADSAEVIAERVGKAEFEIGFAKDYDFQVVNDDLATAIAQTASLIEEFVK